VNIIGPYPEPDDLKNLKIRTPKTVLQKNAQWVYVKRVTNTKNVQQQQSDKERA
jgi:hypothetical protein